MTHTNALTAIYTEFGLTQNVLRGKSRRADLVDVRKIIAQILTYHYGLRSATIARILARDRSIVSYYLSEFARTVDTDKLLSIKFNRAVQAIQS